jgi:hypothetical protein
LDLDLGPRFRTPIWDPDLGPRFETPVWDPDLGPRFFGSYLIKLLLEIIIMTLLLRIL